MNENKKGWILAVVAVGMIVYFRRKRWLGGQQK